MTYKSVDELTPGMILNESIYNQEKVLLLPKGTVFTSEGIALIKKLGFDEVSAQLPPEEKTPLEGRILSDAQVVKFQADYAEAKDNLSEVIKFISAGNRVDMEQAYSVISDLTSQIGSMYNVFAYLNQVQHLDDHTMGHSINTAIISGIICHWMAIDEDMKRDVMVAGLLHDIGKSVLPQDMLDKQEPLTDEEWELYKKHTIYGYQMLKKAGMSSVVQQVALMHHELENGQGYPLGIRHTALPVKIVTLADIYDYMANPKIYRQKLSAFQVMKELKYGYFGVLDTKLLMTFLSRIGECYIGEKVALSDGQVGEIAYVDHRDPTRPLIKTQQGLINLKNLPGVEITDII